MNRREVIVSATALATTGAISACRSEMSQPTLSKSEIRAALSGFAVNLESWWRDIPFEQRFATAAEVGFEQVEFWFVSSWDRDAKTLAKQAKAAGVKVAQIVGDAPALARAGTCDVFLDNMKRAIEDAKTLGTDIVTLTGHQDVEGISKTEALKSYRDHVGASAYLWEEAEVYCAIEPFNPYNHPGHFINGSAEALAICREINSPFVKMNWDIFHMQRAEGNVIDNIKKGADQICYMQMADSPGRHQPGTGEMDYIQILKAVREAGYKRPIGLELWAKDDNYEAALDSVIALGSTEL